MHMNVISLNVRDTLGRVHVSKCLNEVDTSGCSFWTLANWNTIGSDSVLLALYKDTSGDSFALILAEIDAEHHLALKSLAHNVRLARRALGEWALDCITPLFTDREMSSISSKVNLSSLGCRKPCCVFIDSVDFKTTSAGFRSPKQEPDWSYKEKAPAQRYLVITDAKTRIIWHAGPFCPKVVAVTLP